MRAIRARTRLHTTVSKAGRSRFGDLKVSDCNVPGASQLPADQGVAQAQLIEELIYQALDPLDGALSLGSELYNGLPHVGIRDRYG
jgi:hypothetical protein